MGRLINAIDGLKTGNDKAVDKLHSAMKALSETPDSVLRTLIAALPYDERCVFNTIINDTKKAFPSDEGMLSLAVRIDLICSSLD